MTINFFIDPGQRVYVRRIDIVGNYTTQDEVLAPRDAADGRGPGCRRRTWRSSRRRLQRLSYIDSVEITQTRVPGTNDQVDLTVTVTERLAGNFTAGAGFSSGSGLVAGGRRGAGELLRHRQPASGSTSTTARFPPVTRLTSTTRTTPSTASAAGFGFSTRRVNTEDGGDQQHPVPVARLPGLLELRHPDLRGQHGSRSPTRFQRINFDAGTGSSFLVRNSSRRMTATACTLGRSKSRAATCTIAMPRTTTCR